MLRRASTVHDLNAKTQESLDAGVVGRVMDPHGRVMDPHGKMQYFKISVLLKYPLFSNRKCSAGDISIFLKLNNGVASLHAVPC